MSARRRASIALQAAKPGPNKLKKGGKREGTPDKPTTPSQDAFDEEEAASKKQVIINDGILALQIKPEDLEKLREPRPPSDKRPTPVNNTVTVRKLRPASEWDKPPTKMVTVARPAPPEAQLKPTNLACAAGPRFDNYGNIIPHSILGNVEDFTRLAVKHGDLSEEVETCTAPGQSLTLKYEKKKRPEYPKFESSDESNALKNWQRRMLERKKQQGHLSKLLNKPADQLVMNQADSYRQTQELRYIIDRTIPAVDYGKGYRVGSEFWKQQERIGDDLTGIQHDKDGTHTGMTASQGEKGYPQPYENIGIPNAVAKEKGTEWERPKTPFHKPWHKSAYLQQRTEQLHPIMKELVPHKPDLAYLAIVGGPPSGQEPHPAVGDVAAADDVLSETGCSGVAAFPERAGEQEEELDPLRDHPDVHQTPVFGPSLSFGSQPARWTGDSSTFLGQVGIEARVSFETYASKRTTSHLEIINDGTTAIFYDWKPIVKTNPFEMATNKVQRFYFNISSGVILPGDTMKFPFVFKSPNAGVFSEQWQFQTRPVVCGGAALVVTLRGVAIQQDKFKKQRTELEQELAHKQAEQVVRTILHELLEGIRSPERPASPVDAYITEQELFSRKNYGLHYNHELVNHIKDLHREMFEMERARRREVEAAERAARETTGEEDGEKVEEEEEEVPPWDLSIPDIKETIMGMDEDEEKKQELLQRLNTSVIALTFPTLTPKQQHMYSAAYQLMSEALDSVVGEGSKLRTSLGMPERDSEEMPEEPASRSVSPGAESIVSIESTARRVSGPVSRRASAKSQSSDYNPSSAKSERAQLLATPQINRASTRLELKTPVARDNKKTQAKGGKQEKEKKGKDAKGAKDTKASTKDSGKGGKTTPGVAKRPVTREKDQPQSPHSGQASPTPPEGDPILEAKYKEKLYAQSYAIVEDMLSRMDSVFYEIETQAGGPRLPKLT